MSDLRGLCAECGFANVTTYIQSGNVVFTSPHRESEVKSLLEQALAKQLGKPCGVLVRQKAELRALLDHFPFPEAAPNRVLILLLDSEPPPSALSEVATPGGEELRPQGRHLCIHFPNGLGQSKLKIPLSQAGTGRNLNTVVKIFHFLDSLD